MLPRRVGRPGFTLIELLIVGFLIAILVGLLLPAVQKLRETAARNRCSNNLKQLAMAASQFHGEHGAFPPARLTDPPAPAPDQTILTVPPGYTTWVARLLPYLEQNALAERWDLSRPFSAHSEEVRSAVVTTFLCPARRGPERAVAPTVSGLPITLPCGCTIPARTAFGGAVTDYGGNQGDLSAGSSGLPTDFQYGGRGTGVIVGSRGLWADGQPRGWRDRVRYNDILDGASNTAVFGELHVPRGRLAASPENGPANDGTEFYNMSRVGGPGVPLADGPADDVFGMGLFAFGSWHPGICQFAFADGRVVSVRSNLSTSMLGRLTNRSDGEAPPVFE